MLLGEGRPFDIKYILKSIEALTHTELRLDFFFFFLELNYRVCCVVAVFFFSCWQGQYWPQQRRPIRSANSKRRGGHFLSCIFLKVGEQRPVRISTLSYILVNFIGILFKVGRIPWMNMRWDYWCSDRLVHQSLPVHSFEPFVILDIDWSSL